MLTIFYIVKNWMHIVFVLTFVQKIKKIFKYIKPIYFLFYCSGWCFVLPYLPITIKSTNHGYWTNIIEQKKTSFIFQQEYWLLNYANLDINFPHNYYAIYIVHVELIILRIFKRNKLSLESKCYFIVVLLPNHL